MKLLDPSTLVDLSPFITLTILSLSTVVQSLIPTSLSQRRHLFSTFITQRDVLHTYSDSSLSTSIQPQLEPRSEVENSSSSLTIFVLPVLETSWWIYFAISSFSSSSTSHRVTSISLATTWTSITLFQFIRIRLHRNYLASLRLFTLYLILSFRSIYNLSTTLRLINHHDHHDDLRTIDVVLQFVDLGILGWLLKQVMNTPLRNPLPVPIITVDNNNVNDNAKVEEEVRPRSPEDTNTIWGELTYDWINGLIATVKRRELKSFEVWSLAYNNRSRVLSERFQSLKSTSLTRRLLRASARDIVIDASLKLTAVAAEYCRPFFIKRLLDEIVIDYNNNHDNQSPRLPSSSASFSINASHNNNNDDIESLPWTAREKAYLYTFLTLTSMLLKTVAQQRHFHFARRIGMRLRSVLTVGMFEKSLKRRGVEVGAAGGGRRKRKGRKVNVGEGGGGGEEEEEEKDEDEETKKGERGGSNESGAAASIGKVITLVSSDTNSVLRMGCDAHMLYGAPLEIVVGLSLLYHLMGWSSLVGFAVLVMMSPVNYLIGRKTLPVYASRMSSRDLRQSSLQELFASIRTIKLAGWTEAFVERVEGKREEELKRIYQVWIVRLSFVLVWISISALTVVISFSSYIFLQHETLTVPIAFTALSYFELIQGSLYQLPDFGIKLMQLGISIGRLESFLDEPEIERHVLDDEVRRRSDKLSIEGPATLRYESQRSSSSGVTKVDNDQDEEEEDDSSLTGFMLQEVEVEFPKGKLTVVSGDTGSGKTSLFLALLGELEIVEGSVSLPSSVSYASQQPWLESLTVQDNILFGYPLDEDRLNRVIEACALERDLEILPDGRSTFCGERGISLSGGQKARLALARAIYAPSEVVLLDDIFSAVDATTSTHLIRHLFRGPLLSDRTVVLVSHHIDLVLPIADYRVHMSAGRIVEQGPVERAEIEREVGEIATITTTKAKAKVDEDDEAVVTERDDSKTKTGQTAHVETWTSGSVKSSMYTTYLSASGYVLWTVVVILLVILPFIEFVEKLWLAKWGGASNDPHRNDVFYVGGYAILTVTMITLILSPQFIAALGSVRASRTLFHKLLIRVARSPLRWIDTIPLGTLSNRFSNDIGTVDDSLAIDFNSFGNKGTTMVVALFASGFILPSAIAPILLFAGLYGVVFRDYLLLSRDVNRIMATTASPLFSSFAEALRGVTTIRAFSRQEDFRLRLCHLVDETLAFWYLGATLDIWLSIRTELLAAGCLASTAGFAIFVGLEPGLAAVAIGSSQTVINSLAWLCKSYGKLVLDLNALERITEWLTVPQEPVGGIVPSAIWPSSTSKGPLIEVDNLVVKYDPSLPAVLNGISFAVKAGERIGVVGRTGAGKSTLATALLRFTEFESGSIHIDGLDISQISLDVLRKRINYLPQEATLFEGTLRENIDLFHEYSDDECLSALRRVRLLGQTLDTAAPSAGNATPSDQVAITLSTSVATKGSNFSSGQQQLIAMARAFLRDSRIVILDESTASLDHTLDTEIQRILREEFRDSAIITVAHRLRTIRDYDRVLVLDAGEIIEFDSPDALLAKEDGHFKKMWMESRASDL